MERKGWRARVRVWVVAVGLFPITAIVLLHWLGRLEWMRVEWAGFGDWITSNPLEDSLAAIVRTFALTASYWLAGSSIIYLAAKAARLQPLASSVGRLTLPFVRRAVDRALAGALLVSAAAGPVAMASNPPEPLPQVETLDLPFAMLTESAVDWATAGSDDHAMPQSPVEVGEADSNSSPSLPGVSLPFLSDKNLSDDSSQDASDSGTLSRRDGEDSEEDDPAKVEIFIDASLTVVVRPGDHLWDLAARRMTDVLGRPAADHEIAPYWLQVMSANRDRLASGDPDLISPGEVIVLPPVMA